MGFLSIKWSARSSSIVPTACSYFFHVIVGRFSAYVNDVTRLGALTGHQSNGGKPAMTACKLRNSKFERKPGFA
jgi:hypothetical protein